ncbi:MAG: CoA-binding protein, partial [Anaerolineales bacterium]|nr:CoA-binding protein [Anaerolineales bacterium]
MTRPLQPSLRPLLQPTSVAVIGATERPDASSSFVMRNLINHGFRGAIFPVHPRAGQVYGYQAVASISQLESVPDVAVICIAAQHVAGALAEAGAHGVPAAIVLSSGFAETGPAGAARQAELIQVANEYGMALCGPNCLGIVGMHEEAVLYSSRFPHGLPKGRFALISQSGASAIALSGSGRIGFSYIISAGNSAVTGAADYLDFLAGDAGSDVIGLVLENIRQPEKLAAAAEKARAAGKQVIALYFGRSAQGAAATAAHTGALGGSYKAFQAFCRQHGISAVASMDEMLEYAALFSAIRRAPQPAGVALVGVSGGGVAHVADFAAEAGLVLPGLAPATVAGLREILPGYVTPQNPLDVTGLPFADGSVYTRVLAL